MENVFDVAKYILEKTGSISAMKLQKLVYYSQVWHIVWEEEELFSDKVSAYSNGAVIGTLFHEHKGMFKVRSEDFPQGNSERLSDPVKEDIDKVVDFYGKYTAQQLSDLNHREKPWIDARKGLSPGEPCNNPITPAAIMEYYSGLSNAQES